MPGRTYFTCKRCREKKEYISIDSYWQPTICGKCRRIIESRLTGDDRYHMYWEGSQSRNDMALLDYYNSKEYRNARNENLFEE